MFSEKKLQTVFSIKREAENSENKLKIPNPFFCNLKYFGIVDKVVKKREKSFQLNNQRSDRPTRKVHLPFASMKKRRNFKFQFGFIWLVG